MATVGEPILTGNWPRPSGLPAIAQPVSVCHQWSMTGTPSLFLRPDDRVRIGPLAGEEQRAQARHIVIADEFAGRVFLLDGAEGGRRGEQRRDLVSSITRQKVPASGVPTGLPSNTMVVAP
jgi:hypothetical protein